MMVTGQANCHRLAGHPTRVANIMVQQATDGCFQANLQNPGATHDLGKIHRLRIGFQHSN